MFVYQGKLNWYNYGKDETFVIILPSGPVRVGDSVYLFSQWTEDAQGRKKQNWFQTITVDSVTQTDSSDVTFVLKGSWYNFTVTTKGGYKDLSLIMKSPLGGASSPMTLQRIWESKQELTGTTRVWTGKFKWMNFAENEPAIFIVPDGFGEGKPILSMWQWTKASNGKTKDPSFRNEVQKNVTGLGSDTVKFSYHSYYDINCIWDAKTDQLDVHIKENGHTEDVGDMIRSAIIERQKHNQYVSCALDYLSTLTTVAVMSTLLSLLHRRVSVSFASHSLKPVCHALSTLCHSPRVFLRHLPIVQLMSTKQVTWRSMLLT
jgi:hypothetical protein